VKAKNKKKKVMRDLTETQNPNAQIDIFSISSGIVYGDLLVVFIIYSPRENSVLIPF